PAGLDAGSQQHVVNGGQGQFRRVVGLAQVAQRKLFAAVLDQLQQLGGAGAVVQVAAVAGNADFEVIGVGPALQAEPVVVGLQRHQVAAGQVHLHHRRQ